MQIFLCNQNIAQYTVHDYSGRARNLRAARLPPFSFFLSFFITCSAGKVSHEFGKYCAFDKSFGTHKKLCHRDMKKTYLLHKIVFLCICPNSFNNIVKCPLLV